MSSIPREIRYEILLRLPVKSLLACKWVCKNWYTLISTSGFVKSHITIQKNNSILMLKDDSIHLYSIGYDSLPPSSVCEIKDNVIMMDHPLKCVGILTKCSSRSCIGFLGSSNDLICIWLLCFCYQPIGFRESFCLWNPATREYKKLPESPIGFNRGNVFIHGFGYDHKTDDYKLAIGVEAPGSKDTTLVQVHTLASNLWKTEKTIPYRLLFMHMSGVLVNGNLHCSDVNGVKNYSEVWEMLDYGVRESWTKRHVIAHESIINEHNLSDVLIDAASVLGGEVTLKILLMNLVEASHSFRSDETLDWRTSDFSGFSIQVRLTVGAYSKWLDASSNGLLVLPSVIEILMSGMSASEDSAALAL
ncbi:F-box protein CPR1-like [Papaver somniferum]|uniref:F-box protein CPR1-like n=1 Tax=Papaver somniferum TaxID=3469 RepID=UPI000E6FD6E1|nr:F-box protein CPR1-like [Papaver somniferum]